MLNPHPTLIPAIEAGFVDSVYCFGSELGMERYVSNRADIFPVGADGNLRSNRALAQVAGQYACDLFIGGTLQIDAQGNSSTATKGRITGFGGAPNMGADARGRRHDTPAWLRAGKDAGDSLARTQARGADGADPSAERRTEFRRTAGRLRPCGVRRLRATAGDDLWRRRHPCHHRTGRGQPPALPIAAGARGGIARRSPATPSSAGDNRPK